MAMYLRQVCLVAQQLQPAINELTQVLGIEACYVDPGVGKFGLENTLMAVGTNFLEVVAPVKESTAAGRFLAKRRGDAQDTQCGDGGYILVCQVDQKHHQQECRENAAALGVRVAYESSRDPYYLMQLHPADLNNAMWEIDWDRREELDGAWEPAGGIGWKEHVRRDTTVSLTGVELQCEDPLSTATQWGTIAGIGVDSIDGGYRLVLENAELRFVADRDGRGSGLAGVDLTVRDIQVVIDAAAAFNSRRDGDCVELCGTRFYLSDS
jgi:hypothetical protein